MTANSNAPASTPESRQAGDLQNERSQITFSTDDASCVFAGSREARDRNRWLLSLLRDHPDKVFDKDSRPFLGRTERFLRGQKVAQAYYELRNKHGLQKEDRDRLRLLLDEYIPLQVHESMGQPTIESQSSPEQLQEWGPKVSSGRWLVCYAQTELAHGSNLSGLRTTATLDTGSDTWIIDTPEPSAGKCWIGGSGMTTTHAIVMAQMSINNKSFGMHPFLVPMRDPETHKLLPGVFAMDMGPKVGAPAMDNGYITFDHVSIPRQNLMGKFQHVDKDGKYETRNQAAKALTRGAMTLVRVGLIEIAAHHAARATLVATRYSLVRRQGSSKGGAEPQILDYSSVQQRLFTCLSTSWALNFVGQHMRSIYNDLQSALQKGDASLLGTVHGFTSILKACATFQGLDVVETARRSMGGHGYSAASGLTDLERNQPTAGLTYEGDNHMLLCGPAANFLVKTLDSDKRPVRRELDFLFDKPRFDVTKPHEWLDEERQLYLLGSRAAKLVRDLSALRREAKDAATLAYLESALSSRASRAAGSYLILYAFNARLSLLRSASAESIVGIKPAAELLRALEDLRSFYVLEACVLRDVGDFVESGLLEAEQVSWARQTAAHLALRLRKQAIGLAEAADMDDWYLGSPLGHSDGRAYERMIDWMRLEPLNQQGLSGGRDEDGVLKGFRQAMGRLTHGEAQHFNGEAAARDSRL
ncbi:acyl-CoA oxidase [Ceraceosorus guamensis]|uniref:Acyl-coenzyme A oxidase n=1 Tax=Ceraceosorus guamensis TaxID=1522189 RepID=A0A316VX39_9BASI|nr:acyl-CoA oxidase [Ceraceosorus guamensis]PWN41874.1 acyl-CoA oxidase [Ceraceosorus guamensis]